MAEQIVHQPALAHRADSLAAIRRQQPDSDFPTQRGVPSAPVPREPLHTATHRTLAFDDQHVRVAPEQTPGFDLTTHRGERCKPEPLVRACAVDVTELFLEQIDVLDPGEPEDEVAVADNHRAKLLLYGGGSGDDGTHRGV